MNTTRRYDGLALFSGGLDSLLAMKVIEQQGLRVLGLHFVSPFFGKPEKMDHWRRIYDLDLEMVDIGQEYVDMIAAGPEHGFGKHLNPCIDCKIMMLRKARELMPRYGAKFLVSGEVVGQRPMSQRKDALNIIRRDAEVRDELVRPLCALNLDPSAAEEQGLVDRSRLLGIWGRGRKVQLRLAGEFGITEIPTPAGGCQLAEKESTLRYHQVLRHVARPAATNFDLANTGRQVWAGDKWLVTGRNQADNGRLQELVRDFDYVLKVRDYPGPLGLGRPIAEGAVGGGWDEETIRAAAAFTASYSPKAVRAAEDGEEIAVQVRRGEATRDVLVVPSRESGPHGEKWAEPTDREALKEWKLCRVQKG